MWGMETPGFLGEEGAAARKKSRDFGKDTINFTSKDLGIVGAVGACDSFGFAQGQVVSFSQQLQALEVL